MEKYNYDFIADQEPDGNSEWYPAKETDEEIEQYKHTLEHHTKEIKLLTAEIDKKDEQNERLGKSLKKYGLHREDCGLWTSAPYNKCTCGFEKALKGE